VRKSLIIKVCADCHVPHPAPRYSVGSHLPEIRPKKLCRICFHSRV
jgi:hypothetical protein